MPVRKLSFFLSAAVLAALLFVSLHENRVFAGAQDNVSGWAWSENIGWISFNSTNQGSPTSYGVNVDSGGLISGYAWSENIGWISFNTADLAGCPSGTCEARLNLSSGQVSGWARACAGSANGNCTGSARTDGWDGWIHLRGIAVDGTPYGVSVTNCAWDGYGWGSDVPGWIHLKGTNYGVAGSGIACFNPFDYSLTNGGTVSVAPGFTIQNDITLVLNSGTPAPVTLSVSGLPGTATGSFAQNPCTPNCADAVIMNIPVSTSNGTYPITVTGTSPLRTTSFNLIVGPRIMSFTADRYAIPKGSFATLSWTSGGFANCSINQGIGSVPTNGSRQVSPTVRTTYQLTCSSPGSDSAQVTIDILSIPAYQEVPPK